VLDKMPFSGGTEAGPQPEAKRDKPAGRKKSALEKLSRLPGALALTGAMALQTQAGCAGLELPPPELPPSANEVGKGRREIIKRQDECREAGYQARAIMRDPKASARAQYFAAEADDKFRRCIYALDEAVWDDKMFNEAKAALERAKREMGK